MDGRDVRSSKMNGPMENYNCPLIGSMRILLSLIKAVGFENSSAIHRPKCLVWGGVLRTPSSPARANSYNRSILETLVSLSLSLADIVAYHQRRFLGHGVERSGRFGHGDREGCRSRSGSRGRGPAPVRGSEAARHVRREGPVPEGGGPAPSLRAAQALLDGDLHPYL